MLHRPDFETEQDYLAYCCGREIWHKRDELTPSAIRNGEPLSWGGWFAARFGVSLEKAAREWKRLGETIDA